jgi:alkylhydroperoxidase/carboxymuconolactone decarboxylase family protein YurZ
MNEHVCDVCGIMELEDSQRKGGDQVANNRQQILDQFAQNFGLVPDFLSEMPDPVLEQYNNTLNWVLSDTALSARDKALVAFGAATAIHCSY